MVRHWMSRDNVHAGLGTVMMICVVLIIVTFPVTLIWAGRPVGTGAMAITDAFAWLFAVAFFAAFGFAMVDQRRRDKAG